MAKEILSDAVLVQQYASGNEMALAQLIERHKSRIYSFIFSKVKDRDLSDDIFQETFIKVINTIKKENYNEEGKFLPWVMRIAHNLIIDHFRKQSKVKMQRDQEEYSIFGKMIDNQMNIEAQMIAGQIEDDLHLLVLKLPEDQQEIIRLRLYDDLTFKEIAELNDISINTALGRMRYAIINLRKMITNKQIILND
ncbi:sigma-70 family RNA polymerase sigma factor [Flavobacterium sp. CBA20B-1]|uniref:Sigma-70 family RNA polymerase sigma factor n=1 Tax=Paenimyroides aestuarii TaxID=2968490 RepID=A0ABY5NPG9_9FLAO|nr:MULTISPECIES: sigma-70 family RNA polymerase sigma factor [Flavobacteriaceae]UUV20398.1 sigma-70 family RNA polymerase sigma factor [Paenimyroides aestuarii]WCM41841.1 sigma-70 family RNA polymerase sigma factor [Flavobacterium sp. CBA20B-1]